MDTRAEELIKQSIGEVFSSIDFNQELSEKKGEICWNITDKILTTLNSHGYTIIDKDGKVDENITQELQKYVIKAFEFFTNIYHQTNLN